MSRKNRTRNDRESRDERRRTAEFRRREYDSLSQTARQLRDAENFEKYQADVSDRYEKMY